MSLLTSILRRHPAAVLVLAAAAMGLHMLGVTGLQRAQAQQECDAQCWAILRYLTEQGLTSDEIEDLGNSGIEPDRPAPVPTTTAPPTTAPPTTTVKAKKKKPATTTTVRRSTRRTTTTTTTTTTTIPPTETESSGRCGPPPETWACNEVESGIEEGYLPEDFDPHDEADSEQVRQIVREFGNKNTGFDADAALRALEEMGDNVDRGEIFNAIAAGLRIDYDPTDGFDVADELADLGILLGHDRDGDGDSDPYTRTDADADGVLHNGQLAALLDRISDQIGNDRPTTTTPKGKKPNTGAPDPRDPEDPCASGLELTSGQREQFLSDLHWETLARIAPHRDPAVEWPPHPDVPGGADFLVVSQSPVWPVVDTAGQWGAVNAEGCVWSATEVHTTIAQLLPWRTEHRDAVAAVARSRPGAGFDVYLQRWDNLSPREQADARRHHVQRSVDVACGFDTAKSSANSYGKCRWEVPFPGVWEWEARACFEAYYGDDTYRDCATLASGVEWFLGILDYTSGITMQADSSAGASRGSGRAGAAA